MLKQRKSSLGGVGVFSTLWEGKWWNIWVEGMSDQTREAVANKEMRLS